MKRAKIFWWENILIKTRYLVEVYEVHFHQYHLVALITAMFILTQWSTNQYNKPCLVLALCSRAHRRRGICVSLSHSSQHLLGLCHPYCHPPCHPSQGASRNCQSLPTNERRSLWPARPWSLRQLWRALRMLQHQLLPGRLWFSCRWLLGRRMLQLRSKPGFA